MSLLWIKISDLMHTEMRWGSGLPWLQGSSFNTRHGSGFPFAHGVPHTYYDASRSFPAVLNVQLQSMSCGACRRPLHTINPPSPVVFLCILRILVRYSFCFKDPVKICYDLAMPRSITLRTARPFPQTDTELTFDPRGTAHGA